MKKLNQKDVKVVAEDVKVEEEVKGGMNMKTLQNNKFIKKDEFRKEEKKAEIKQKKEQEILDSINPVDITGVMKAVENKEAYCFRNEEGEAQYVGGGKYLQKPLNLGGSQWTIAAKTEEELAAKEKAIKEEGLSGDGLYHKTLTIGGYPCECVGATPEELDLDILAAKKYAKKLSEGSILHDTDTAEQLCDAGLEKESLEEIKVDNNRYIINYNNIIINNEGEEVVCPCILTFEGDLVVSLEGLSSSLSKEDTKTILVERLKNYLKDHYDPLDDYEEYDDEEDYRDYYNEEEGYEDDDEEEEGGEYEEGYNDGYSGGYDDGYDIGKGVGYTLGTSDTEKKIKEASDEAFDDGKRVGYGVGYIQGRLHSEDDED
jgi:hypothetical protein